MPVLHINYAPAMTRHLVAAGAFRKDPLVVVDVGARGGVESYWQAFGEDLRVIAFEPDAEECARLNQGAIRYLPFAISKDGGRKPFFIHKYPGASSLYRVSPDYSRFANSA